MSTETAEDDAAPFERIRENRTAVQHVADHWDGPEATTARFLLLLAVHPDRITAEDIREFLSLANESNGGEA